jgi:mRNA-degrading endonuclease toxin of MazEF toxin-antitoxin module
MYIKNFDKWNKSKKIIENRNNNHLSSFRERDVWWCSIGINIGSEEDGKNEFFERPVLVLRKFNNRMSWVIPMSTKMRLNKYNYYFENEVALMSQLRIVSNKRLNRFIRRISTYEFSTIRWSICDLINYE